MTKAIVLAGLLSSVALSANATSVLTNGDFEAGDTGFMSDFASTPGLNTGAAQYTVDNNPGAWNGGFSTFGDHTIGSGNMMMVNGSTTAGDVVWSQNVNVMANTDYTFSGWIASLFPGASELSVMIGSSMLGSIVGPATTAVWESFDFAWNSGMSTNVTITLLQQSTGFGGNDYALDDLSFVGSPMGTIPLPAGLPLMLAGLGALAVLRRRAS